MVTKLSLGQKVLSAVALVLAALLACTNFMLIRQNGELRKVLDQLNTSRQLRPGEIAAPMKGKDIHGSALELTYGEDRRKTLLLVFSPKCQFCDQNWPIWNSISNTVNRDMVRMAFINIGANISNSYVNEHHLESAFLIATLEPWSREAGKLHSTPQTILLDRNGRVERIWSGVLSNEAHHEVGDLVSMGVKRESH
jgi:hypothetical protein